MTFTSDASVKRGNGSTENDTFWPSCDTVVWKDTFISNALRFSARLLVVTGARTTTRTSTRSEPSTAPMDARGTFTAVPNENCTLWLLSNEAFEPVESRLIVRSGEGIEATHADTASSVPLLPVGSENTTLRPGEVPRGRVNTVCSSTSSPIEIAGVEVSTSAVLNTLGLPRSNTKAALCTTELVNDCWNDDTAVAGAERKVLFKVVASTLVGCTVTSESAINVTVVGPCVTGRTDA